MCAPHLASQPSLPGPSPVFLIPPAASRQPPPRALKLRPSVWSCAFPGSQSQSALSWVILNRTILKLLFPIPNGALYCVCHKFMYSSFPDDYKCKVEFVLTLSTMDRSSTQKINMETLDLYHVLEQMDLTEI
uniref:Uncharacterized protein n=2 Tax=Ursus TaxID=9639 RepID=A0A452TFY0_URSMA